MKKFYLGIIAFIALISFGNNAKAASGTIDLTGIVLTDINGVTYDLEQLQNDGYIIIFDFWATWCGPCLASGPALNEIWSTHGPDGDGTAVVFSIETDLGTSNEVAIINQEGIENPVFLQEDNQAVRSSDFAYTGSIPYFTVVCPDGSWNDRTGGVSVPSTLLDLAICFASDATITSSVDGGNCPAESWIPEFTLKNVGSDTLTSATITISVDGTVHETINWTGNIASLGTESIVGTLPVDYIGVGTQNVEYAITSVNNGTDGNVNNNILSKVKSFKTTEELNLKLELVIDNYPEETGYEVIDENGTVLFSETAGAYANASNNPIIDIILPNAQECYTFKLTDSYGDGSHGFIVRDTMGNEILVNEELYTYTTSSDLYVGIDSDNDGFLNVVEGFAGSDENDSASTPITISNITDADNILNFNVYPNPSSSILNIDVETANNQKLTVELTNILGQVIDSKSNVNSTAQFNISELNNGVYFINVILNSKSVATTKVFKN